MCVNWLNAQCDLNLISPLVEYFHWDLVDGNFAPDFTMGSAIIKTLRKKYLHKGYGALLGFELKDGEEAGKNFIDNLKLLYHVANIGDARSLAIHPASTTHSQLSSEEQLSSGVTPGYVRLSIGIEHIDDIINDIEQSLEKL